LLAGDVNTALGVDGVEDPVVQIEGEEVDDVRDIMACLMAREAMKWCPGLAGKHRRSSVWVRFGSDCVEDVDLLHGRAAKLVKELRRSIERLKEGRRGAGGAFTRRIQ
jgi:hypothetical protein